MRRHSPVPEHREPSNGSGRRRRGGGFLELIKGKKRQGSPKGSRKSVLDFFQSVRAHDVPSSNNNHNNRTPNTNSDAAEVGSTISNEMALISIDSHSGGSGASRMTRTTTSSTSSPPWGQSLKNRSRSEVRRLDVPCLQQHAVPELSSAFLSASIRSRPPVSHSPPPSPTSAKREAKKKQRRTRSPEGGVFGSHAVPGAYGSGNEQQQQQGGLYKAVSAGAPLHIIQNIAEDDPDATARQNNGGMTPLHCAIERYDVDTEVLLALLASNPGAASIRSRRGHNSVDLLWTRFVDPEPFRSDEVKRHASQVKSKMTDVVTGFSLNIEARAHHALGETAELRTFWTVISTFIGAACHGRCTSESDPDVVHDAIVLNCDPLLIQFASALYPYQLRHRNAAGQLPLHTAAASGNGRTLRTVLALNPQAAIRLDRRGRLPLHEAIESGISWDDGVAQLVKANPRSLLTLEPKSGLFPAAYAAMDGNQAELTTIFKLMKEQPAEVSQLALAATRRRKRMT